MKKNRENIQPLIPEPDKPGKSLYFHYLLIALGIFFLLQDLLAEIFKHTSVISKTVKSVDELSSFVLLGLVVFTRMSRGRLFPSININGPLLYFCILLLIPSIIYQVQPFVIISQLIIYLKAFCYFYIFAGLNLNKTLLYKYLNTFFRAGVILIFLGLIDFLAPVAFRRLTGNIIYTEYKFGLPAVKSLFIHPYLMGWFMSFIALFSFSYFLICRKTHFLWATIIFGIGCFFSLRAKSIAGLGCGLLCGFLLAPLILRLKIRIFIVLLPLILTGLVFTAPVIGNVLQAKIQFYFFSEDTIEIARNVLTLKSFQVARDYFPLGAGLGRYGSYLSTLYYSPLYSTYGLSRIWGLSREHPDFITDTFWPMVIGEAGYFGLGLYILILILMFVFMYREMKTENDNDRKAFHLGTMLVLIEGVVESIAAPIFSSPPPGIFILSAVGICYALQRSRLYEAIQKQPTKSSSANCS